MALDIPTEILHEIIAYLDDITTIRFLSTCTFLHKREIKCTKFLIENYIIIHNPISDHLQWLDSLRWLSILHARKSYFSTLLLTVTNLNQYFDIRKYLYMCKINFRAMPQVRIYGFYTDIELDTVKTIYCQNNQANIIYSKIIDHGAFRQVIFESIVYNRISIHKNKMVIFYIDIYRNSEIIKGRHSIYIENNITVDHTTLNENHMYNKSYFLSCYTQPLIF